MSLNILVTGANGQVGWHLRRTLAPLGAVTALSREEFNIGDLNEVSRTLKHFAPDIVVNAGAYTAVDKAEGDPPSARRVNAAGPEKLAVELAQNNGLLVHYSTDYVFDGTKSVGLSYEESEPTCPLNVYGQSKLEGEELIAASGCPYIILRTSWVFDTRGKNFLRTVLRLAQEREELRMVADQYGAPTWARMIAEATAGIVARNLEQSDHSGKWRTGLFHLTAAGKTTWAGFAEAILEDYNALCGSVLDSGEFGMPLMAQRVVPIPSEEYPTPALRPRNSALSCAKIRDQFGIALPDWRSQLRLAMQDAIR